MKCASYSLNCHDVCSLSCVVQIRRVRPSSANVVSFEFCAYLYHSCSGAKKLAIQIATNLIWDVVHQYSHHEFQSWWAHNSLAGDIVLLEMWYITFELSVSQRRKTQYYHASTLFCLRSSPRSRLYVFFIEPVTHHPLRKWPQFLGWTSILV